MAPGAATRAFALIYYRGGLLIALMPLGMVTAGMVMRRIPNSALSIVLSQIGVSMSAIGIIVVGSYHLKFDMSVLSAGSGELLFSFAYAVTKNGVILKKVMQQKRHSSLV